MYEIHINFLCKELKGPLGRKWEDNFKIDLEFTSLGVSFSIRNFVNTVINLRVA
jgi:hypothetical protein